MEVSGHRKIGRPKLRWRKDVKETGVQREDSQDRSIEEEKLDEPTPNRGKVKEEEMLIIYS